MFLDERLLTVRSGDGGDGLAAWRREARIPFGGPAGGDGGRGGDVVLIADPNMSTFSDMENVRQVRAEHGERGGPNCCHGRRGADRELGVPVGTTVYAAKSGRRLVDLVEPGQRYVVARGGRGGRGNARFATATVQAPTRYEEGRKGRIRSLRLELRLLADVGLIGLPNAGKSTLLRRISRATPRVADYPFTTLAPHLGIVELDPSTRFVVADLPGLVEGAHAGHGLGDRFLRHVERTRILVHLVDLEPLDGSDPVEAYRTIREELKAGRGPARAIELGYEKALSAIIDANITTVITAAILFIMGSGPVKGFAVTLFFGIITSVFAAIYVTRLLLVMWFERRRPKTITV